GIGHIVTALVEIALELFPAQPTRLEPARRTVPRAFHSGAIALPVRRCGATVCSSSGRSEPKIRREPREAERIEAELAVRRPRARGRRRARRLRGLRRRRASRSYRGRGARNRSRGPRGSAGPSQNAARTAGVSGSAYEA